MAKKKRKPDKQGPKSRKPPQSGDFLELPTDPRVIEALMQQFLGGTAEGEADPDDPLSQAQQLVYQAYDEEDDARREQLAREALAISPDCADAYVLLAELAPNVKEAVELYRQGVAAGERALGPEAFTEGVGNFWLLHETRPYMRARQGLAHALWTAGQRDEAVEHLRDMLRLNPNDNQGVRYTLAGHLLFLGRDDELAELLKRYEEDASAAWAYTLALLAFRRLGDTPEARRMLKQALKTNKHVPDYLLGRKFPPMEQPSYYSPGDANEALEYVAGFLAGWKDTPGAIAWLRSAEEEAAARKKPAKAKGPTAAELKRLKKLPREEDVWQAEFRQLASPIETDDGRLRPWLVLIASRDNEAPLAHDVPEDEPTATTLWQLLAQALTSPTAGEPHRPTVLEVRPDARWDELRPTLAELDIELTTAEELDPLTTILDHLGEQLGGEPQPGLLDVPGMTPERAGGFYAAAADFYRQAPWKKVGYESAIAVHSDRHPGTRYAVLMGQSGLTTGLALYEDLDLLRRMWAGEGDDEENAQETVATTVTFGDPEELPGSDLDAAQEHGWEVARPDAFPSVFHKEEGMTLRPPTPDELELLEACLRAVPDFVSRRPQDDTAEETLTVQTAAGPLQLTLSWVGD